MDGGEVGVSGAMIVVQVALEDVSAITGMASVKGHAMVEDVMYFGEIMLGFVRGNRYGCHSGKGGVDEVEIQEIAGVEATKAPDESPNAEITEEEERSNLATATRADGSGGEIVVEAEKDTAEFWESEAGGLGAKSAVAAHDWGGMADGYDVRHGEEIPGVVEHELRDWLGGA